jgi:hypothetical protein
MRLCSRRSFQPICSNVVFHSLRSELNLKVCDAHQANYTIRKMPGKGNGRTKLLSYQHAMELIMVLPGQTAKIIRQGFVNLITRYNSGDLSLIKEIKVNAASDEPMHRMAEPRRAIIGVDEGGASSSREPPRRRREQPHSIIMITRPLPRSPPRHRHRHSWCCPRASAKRPHTS